jgi:hypothetical protein
MKFNLTVMSFFTEKIRRIFKTGGASLKTQNQPFDFIRSKKDILRELRLSRDSGDLIGLIAPLLGHGMLFVVVQSIEFTRSQEVVVFTKHDIHGLVLSTGIIDIGEIKGVCPFVKGKRTTVLVH